MRSSREECQPRLGHGPYWSSGLQVWGLRDRGAGSVRDDVWVVCGAIRCCGSVPWYGRERLAAFLSNDSHTNKKIILPATSSVFCNSRASPQFRSVCCLIPNPNTSHPFTYHPHPHPHPLTSRHCPSQQPIYPAPTIERAKNLRNTCLPISPRHDPQHWYVPHEA